MAFKIALVFSYIKNCILHIFMQLYSSKSANEIASKVYHAKNVMKKILFKIFYIYSNVNKWW